MIPISKDVPSSSKHSRQIKRRWMWAALVQLPLTFVLLTGLLWVLYQFQYQKPPLPSIPITQTLSKTVASLQSMRFPILRMLGFNGDFPEIAVDVKLNDIGTLKKVMEHDIQSRSDQAVRREVKVPARLRIDGNTVPVRLRLKGDRSIHWQDPRNWSFKVEVKKDRTFLGMTEFSLQRPVTRNYAYEWLFHKFLQNENLINSRYLFATVQMNGSKRGVYVLEEHFSKFLIENNHRREGPILGFGETFFDQSDQWRGMPIVVYNRNKWLKKDPAVMDRAVNLLENLQQGYVSVSDVLDVDAWGKYFAITDLLEMFHGAVPKSVKFYFNPLTNLFEPIGHDGHFLDKQYPVLISEAQDFKGNAGFWGYKSWFQTMFEVKNSRYPYLYAEYVKQLRRMLAPGYLEKFFQDIAGELDAIQDLVYSDFPFADLWSMHPRTGLSPLYHLDLQEILDRRELLRHKLNPAGALSLHVKNSDDEKITLDVVSRAAVPIEIIDLYLRGQLYRPVEVVIVPGRRQSLKQTLHTVKFKKVRLTDDNAGTIKGMARTSGSVTYSIVGSDERNHARVSVKPGKGKTKFPKKTRYRDPEQARFWEINRTEQTITFKPGKQVIEGVYFVPGGYSLIGKPNTSLDLINGGHIVSYGSVFLEGTEEDKFEITSSDGTGIGFHVLQASKESRLTHVNFTNLGQLGAPLTGATGAIMFYESDVSIENTKISGMKSEDSINIIRSTFKLVNLSLQDSSSDGIDIDFSSGSLKNVSVIRCGNDGIDFSGSVVEMSNVDIQDVSDKGISIGERSGLTIEALNVLDARIGVAVKDSSTVDLYESKISNVAVGVAIYQKKIEYGPSSANIWRLVVNEAEDVYRLEEASRVIVDGKRLSANSENLGKLLYSDSSLH